ncbi:hypothetical protein CCR80_01405 [Rhodothalassium salexigens]|nr:hypothetical protein [Rhodothalassium salexigens]
MRYDRERPEMLSTRMPFIRQPLRRLLWSAAVLVPTAGLMAGPAQAVTLREALATAYTSNPTLEAQRAQLRAVDENVARANSNWRPTVSGQMSVGQSRIESVQPGNPQSSIINSDDRTYSGQINQPVFRGFANFNARSRAEAEVEAGRAQLLQTEQQVLQEAATVFMDVVRDQAVLSLNDNQVKVLRRQLEASQDRFRVGEITRTDVAQSEARLAGAISARIQAQGTLETSRATYERVVGNYPGTLDKPADLPELPADLDTAREMGTEMNPVILAARANEQAAKFQVEENKGQLLPQIDLRGSVSRNVGAFGPFTQSTDRLAASAQINIPLYQGGAVSSDIRRAKQTRSQRLMQIAEANRQVYADVRSAWEQFRAARASIESTSSQVSANEIALEGVRQEAAVGSRTTLDVLDAEQELLNSRVELVRAERNQFAAAFALLRAVGLLNAREMALDVEYYDPTYNYRRVKWKHYGFGVTDGRAND